MISMADLCPGEISLMAPATILAFSASPFRARQIPRVSMAPMCFWSMLMALMA